ncbi:MAG: ATP-binding protein [Clostridiales bacterium]|nr:ATP-binding protein [Clostridiales bacterium]
MDNTLVGRRKEKDELLNLFQSGRAEFITIYGRRRVGKTFLVNNLFSGDYAFKVTAVLDESTERQLKNFAKALSEYSKEGVPFLADWFTAFDKLRVLLEKSNRKRKVVFFDEMPWFDAKGSRFISALEHFWNSWASTQSDVMLIVCGSAASWIVKKLFRNRGGLHNRITRRIFLQPFTLAECRLYAQREGFPTDELSLLETYMTFGGIPYYLSLMNKNLSLAQNINHLCFTPGGELREEFDNLYASLFSNAARHILVVEALGKKKSGLTREDIKRITKLPEGGSLSEALEELELSGFIRKYTPFAKKKKGMIYQLIDHFTLFHLAFVKGSSDDDPDHWMKKRETQAFRTWRGYAFEQVCLSHINQIKKAIGVAGVITHVESWRSERSDPGVQIDLMINRNDQVVSLCEMKFSDTEFSFTKKLAQELRTKRNVFLEETRTKKAVHITLITPFGIKRNDYFDMVQSLVTAEDLLKD